MGGRVWRNSWSHVLDTFLVRFVWVVLPANAKNHNWAKAFLLRLGIRIQRRPPSENRQIGCMVLHMSSNRCGRGC